MAAVKLEYIGSAFVHSGIGPHLEIDKGALF